MRTTCWAMKSQTGVGQGDAVAYGNDFFDKGKGPIFGDHLLGAASESGQKKRRH